MDFFQHQDRARRRTGLLLVYFVLAVLATVIAVNVLAWALSLFVSDGEAPPPFGAWLTGAGGGWTTLVTLLVIGAGSLARYISLGGGGRAVAETVKARRIDPGSNDPKERMLLNIVEEMAIASGTPAPTVWLMEHEAGINAFVAGFEPTEAVLVVTRGALDTFNRDQMQGVVGHEFSHILNGDMRLNVQLYAILAGILLVGKIGEFLLRSAGRSSGGDSAKGAAAVFVIGLSLMLIGYAGLFFGRLIKAAISRQREFLADASSVQFTRNPDGIGEALLAIRNAGTGSLLYSAEAEDMSHMCIALPVRMTFSSLLATHPPLDERIGAIDPALLARDRARRHTRQVQAAAAPAQAAGFAGNNSSTGVTASTPTAVITAQVGRPTPAHTALAQDIQQSIPGDIRTALRTADDARLVMYGLVLCNTAAGHDATALQRIRETENSAAATRLAGMLPALRTMGSRLHLPCQDLALPALRTLAPERKAAFLATLEQLVHLDGRYLLRESLLLALMRKHLAPDAGNRRPVRHRSYRTVADPLAVVLSLLCHAAGGSDAGRRDLYQRVMQGFGTGTSGLLPPARLGPQSLHAALAELADLTPLLKKPLIDACVDCVRHDGRLQVVELELVRAVGEALDCPVPPLVGLHMPTARQGL
ncbi:MAG: M48 family metallopeptidase [Pseudomonadota bacterium]